MPIALLPVESFFRAPRRARAQLSPDGRRVAYLAPWENHLNIWVRDIDGWRSPDAPLDDETESRSARRVTAEKHRSLETFSWTPDSTALLYQQDLDGDENHHLFRVDVESGEATDLTPYPGVRVFYFSTYQSDPNTAYVDLNLRAPDQVDTFRMDLSTKQLTLLVDSDDKAGATTLVSPTGEIYHLRVDTDGDWELSHRRDGALRTITTFTGPDHVVGPLPLVFTPDGAGLWLGTNRNSDRTRLVRVDLATGEEQGVDDHPVYDLDTPRPEADQRFPSALIINPGTGDLVGARYLGERAIIHPLNSRFAEVLERLRALSDVDLGHISFDTREQRWIVEFIEDRVPAVTWFYDHDTGDARELFRSHPHLDVDTLARVTPITVPSRDGLDLHCHLTLPADEEPTSLPTVVLLHGGPWYRDAWGYDPEVQFLANRGYAVLQVNFRGSTGYGKAFLKAGIRQFAGRMHDDVIDALDHVIDRGIADPRRVAIYGASYGGYAALVGATFTPDRFAAAVSYAGMSDLVKLYDESLPAIRSLLTNSYGLHIGDPSDADQRADMQRRSPATHLDRVTAPVMLIHGSQDVRVTQSHSDLVASALRARGIEVDYLVNPREGHWFINPESNVELYSRLERFLARHLGGRVL